MFNPRPHHRPIPAPATRTDKGKVKIVKKHEQPTRQGAWGGLGIGLVGGALVALFPAVGLGAGLLLGGAGGAGLGALGGHVAAGMSRSDLKESTETTSDTPFPAQPGGSHQKDARGGATLAAPPRPAQHRMGPRSTPS